MLIRLKSFSFLLLLALLLAACTPAAATPLADEVATAVAATIAAEGDAPPVDAATQAPTDAGEATSAPTGEPDPYGACANSGALSVAYLKENNVWLWVQGSDPVALTASGDVLNLAISEDGCRVAYTREAPNPDYDPEGDPFSPELLKELWVVNSDGSDSRLQAGLEYLSSLPSVEDNPLDIYRFAWQPGSHTLAFNTAYAGYGLLLSDDIHLVDVNSAEISTLLPAGEGGQFYWSPDGSQIAFSTPTTINRINSDGSGLQELLAYEMVITYSEFQYYVPLNWSPEGDELMAAIPPADGLAPPEDGVYPETELWYMPLDGSDPFLAGAIQNVWFSQSEVRFSPDISRIVYLRPLGEQGDNRQELVLALSDGSNESANIEEDRITIGAWSPDSNQLIYSYASAGGPEIRLLQAGDGSSSVGERLTQFQADVVYFRWPLPESYLQILYRGADNFIELSLMNLDGSGEIIDAYHGSPFELDSAP